MSWWALLANAAGSTINQRSQAAAQGQISEAQMAHQQRMAEMEGANTRNIATAARRWDLEDREYRTGQFSSYGQFGDESLPSRGAVRSQLTPVEAPQAIPEPAAAPLKPGQKPPKKPKNPPPPRGLMYFG